jgi:hypothetical protein
VVVLITLGLRQHREVAASAAIRHLTSWAFWACCLAWVAFKLTRRSRVRYTVFTIIVALPLLALGIALIEQHRRQAAWKEFSVQVREGMDLGTVVQALRRVQSKLPATDATAAAQVAEMLSNVAKRKGALMVALNALTNAGGVYVSTLRARDQLRQRQELVQAVIRANDQRTRDIDDFLNTLRTRLEPLGANPTAKAMLAAFEPRVPLMKQDCQLVDEFAQLMKARLELLDASWGRWSWNSNKNQVIFQDTSTLQAYNKNAERTRKLEEESIRQNQLGR